LNAKHRKRRLLWFTLLLSIVFLVSTSRSNPVSASFSWSHWDKSIVFKIPKYGSYVKFNQNYSLSSYVWDDSGFNATTIKFYNLKMSSGVAPSPWQIEVQGPANVTITRLFTSKVVQATNYKVFEATVSASSGVTSTTQISCGSYEKPTEVIGASSWSYDSSNKILSISVQHSSDANIEVRWVIAPLSKPLGYVRQIWTGFLPVLFVIISVALLNALLKGEIETREFTWAIIGLAIGTAVLMILLQVVEGL